MKKFSAVILAKDEEKNIRRAVLSVGFADEVLVIDDGSTDSTAQIATKLKANVIPYRGADDYSARRNCGMSKAANDWVFFLDADEVVSPELQDAILKLPENTDCSTYFVRRIDDFWGKQVTHGELWNAWFARLVNKKRGTFVRPVHEVWKCTTGTASKLPGLLLHYPHPTVAEFLASVNSYSTRNARTFLDEGRKTNIFDILFTPFFKFVYTYFVRLGFLDGTAGFVYSFMMSFHSFLTRAKLYLLINGKNS